MESDSDGELERDLLSKQSGDVSCVSLFESSSSFLNCLRVLTWLSTVLEPRLRQNRAGAYDGSDDEYETWHTNQLAVSSNDSSR